MTQRKIWTPNDHDNRGLIALARRVRIRPRVPPRARVGVRYEPQYLHWQVINPDGTVAREGEQHNMLLNAYKSLVPTYGFTGDESFKPGQARGKGLAEYAVVGTGSTPPDPTQTTLVAEAARTNNWTGEDDILFVSDGVYDLKVVREFPAGTFSDTPLAEWGFSPSGTTGDPLMSRELFRDASVNPTVVTVSASQKLRFYYYVRLTIQPFPASAASINISGLGTLTGRVYVQRATGQGVWNESGRYYKGPVWLVDAFARGVTGYSYRWEDQPQYFNRIKTQLQVGVLHQTVDEAFTTANQNASKTVKGIAFSAPGANSRATTATVFGTTEANNTIYGFIVGMRANDYIYPKSYVTTFARYVFVLDAGQEFVKDNLHTLTVDPITLTW